MWHSKQDMIDPCGIPVLWMYNSFLYFRMLLFKCKSKISKIFSLVIDLILYIFYINSTYTIIIIFFSSRYQSELYSFTIDFDLYVIPNVVFVIVL